MSVLLTSRGWATTLQDSGRSGFAHLGVPRSGPVDRRTFDLVNRLVGNAPGATAMETAGGLVVTALAPTIVASSSDGARVTLGTGDHLRVDPAATVRWAYLAVRGGFEVDAVLGSRSQESVSGLGPPSLIDGDVLTVGDDPGTPMPAEFGPLRTRSGPIRIWAGPRTDWWVDGLGILTDRRWTVTAEVSRVGLRLQPDDGDNRHEPTTGRWKASMPSEGVADGAIQMPPSGEPIVMLADHPTTGGYPVIAVVDPDDLHRLAQAGPGATIAFASAQSGSAG
jgi:biotin-dependent carboxylase-like uncharacterized protein